MRQRVSLITLGVVFFQAGDMVVAPWEVAHPRWTIDAGGGVHLGSDPEGSDP